MAIKVPQTLSASLEEPGLIETGLGGFVTGLRRDPLVRPVVDTLAEITGNDPALFDELEMRIRGSTLADVTGIIGEYGPTLLGGMGAYSLGRAAMTTMLPKAAGLWAVRTAQLAGGALGTGAFSGTQALAGGATLPEAAKQAGLTALLSAGSEAALIGVAKAIAPRARFVTNAGEQIQRFAELRSGVAREAQVGSKLAALRHRLSQLLDTDALEKQLSLFPEETVTPSAAQGELFTSGREALESAAAKAASVRAGRIRRLEQRIAKTETLQRAAQGFGDETQILPTEIVRSKPIQFGDTRLGQLRKFFEQTYARTLQTPEALAQKTGVTGLRTMQLAETADNTAYLKSRFKVSAFMEWTNKLGRAVGAKPFKSIEQADDVLGPVLQVAEREGAAGVRAQFGDEAARLIDEFSTFSRDLYTPVVKIGGERFMTPGELAAQGTAMYWPHVPQFLGDEEFVERTVAGLVKQGMGQVDARAAADLMMRTSKQGLAKWGSIDYQRLTKGTLAQKIQLGMPFERPIMGMVRHIEAVERRVAFGERFGFSGELRDQIMEYGRKEGVDTRLLSTLLDGIFQRDIGEAGARAAAQVLTSLQTASKMTFGVFGNITQQGSNTFVFGTKNALKGAFKGLKKHPGGDALAAAILDDEFQAMRRIYSGTQKDTWADKIAQNTLNWTGFNRAEGWNRAGSTATADYFMRETIGRAMSGKLRGLDRAAKERLLGRMGINLDKVVEAAKAIRPGQSKDVVLDAVNAVHGADAYALSMFKGAKLTQFIPGRFDLPPAWLTPWGRILTQYKRFALYQGRLIRDQVLAEAARGNMKPLVTVASIYPVMGEAVAASLAGIKDKDRPEGVLRLVDNVASIGGFGIAYSAAVAAQYGRLEDVFVGPTISDVMSASEAILRGDLDGLATQAQRLPIAQAGTAILRGSVATAEEMAALFDQADQ